MKIRTKQFLSQLAGFLSVRDDLDNVAATVLPEDLASTYDPVGMDIKPMQDENLLAKLEDPKSASIGDTLDVILEIAQNEIKPLLDAFGKAIVEKIQRSEGAGEDSHYPKYKSAPLKSKARAEEKIRNEYDGNPLRIVDLVRASLVVNSEHQLATLLSTLLNKDEDDAFPHIQVIRFKNRFQRPTFSGYRDCLFNLQITNNANGEAPSGHAMICELQVHLAQVIVHKPMSHYYYGYFRQFFSGNMDVVEERMNLLTSLGAQVKNFRQDVDLEKTSKSSLDIDAILASLCKEGSTTEIDPSLLEKYLEESEDTSDVGALIDELVPLWDLQDILKANKCPDDAVDRYEDVPPTATNGDLGIDELYAIAEDILPVFNALGMRLMEELPIYYATQQDLFTIREALEKGEQIDLINPYELEEILLKPKDLFQALADTKYGGDLSQVRIIVCGSISATGDYALVKLFEYMKQIAENGDVEIVGFKNNFRTSPEEDLLTTFIGYQQAVYHLLMKTDNGATMVVELQVDLDLNRPYKQQALHYLELLGPYLSGKEDSANERQQLLDSFEKHVKTSQGREYAGLVDAMIESFGENGEFSNLRTFETLLGPLMLYDVKLAIVSCRERLWAISTKMPESQEKIEEILDAKAALGEALYEHARLGESEMDGSEAVELLQRVRKELLEHYGNDRHPKYLRASMIYFTAWLELGDIDSAEGKDHIAGFKNLVDNMEETLGSGDSMTIRCKHLLASNLYYSSEKDSGLDLLRQAYSEGVRCLGESHPVTLNIGIDLSFAYSYCPDKPDNLVTFVESVYKGSMAVFGRTVNALDLELSYVHILYKATADATKYTSDQRQQMAVEASRLEAIHSAGIATEYLDFAFDGKWYKKTPWSELPVKVKNAAAALNWEVDEKSESWYPIESRKWEDLSEDEKKGARTLGFNRHSWKDLFDGFMYLKEDWNSLSNEVKESCEVLGWSEEKWGAQTLIKEESRKWPELTSDEKAAAKVLNFELRSWNMMFVADAFENSDGGDY